MRRYTRGSQLMTECGARRKVGGRAGVFKALRLLYHSTLGLRVIKKKKGRAGALTYSVRGRPFFSICSSIHSWNVPWGVSMCSGSEAGSCLRLTDSCITQLKVQGPSRTCNESKEEEEEARWRQAESPTRPPSDHTKLEARNPKPDTRHLNTSDHTRSPKLEV